MLLPAQTYLQCTDRDGSSGKTSAMTHYLQPPSSSNQTDSHPQNLSYKNQGSCRNSRRDIQYFYIDLSQLQECLPQQEALIVLSGHRRLNRGASPCPFLDSGYLSTTRRLARRTQPTYPPVLHTLLLIHQRRSKAGIAVASFVSPILPLLSLRRCPRRKALAGKPLPL